MIWVDWFLRLYAIVGLFVVIVEDVGRVPLGIEERLSVSDTLYIIAAWPWFLVDEFAAAREEEDIE